MGLVNLVYGLLALVWRALPVVMGLAGYFANRDEPVLGLLYGLWWALAGALVREIVAYVSPPSTAYGSARFAGYDDLVRGKLLSNQGVILGRKNGRLVRYAGDGHLLTFAPTRSGKGVGCVIPNLLTWPGSVVVTDIKGENIAIAGRYRASLGQVFELAPFKDTDTPTACYNPFDFIRKGSQYEVDDTRLIAEMLVVPERHEANHWEREARTLITGLILHITQLPERRKQNLGYLRQLLMDDLEGFDLTLAAMMNNPHPVVSRIASGFSQKEPKERSAVVSTAQGATEAFKSPLLARMTANSSFSLEDLKTQTISLFLVIPPEYLDTYRPFLRLMIGLCTAAMTRKVTWSRHEVLFLLDELPALGYMRPIEEGIGYLAGYRAKLWLFVQDLDQLQKTYPKARSIVANCAVRQAINVQDPETAKLLSNMMGTATVRRRSEGNSGKLPLRWLSGSYQSSIHEGSRELMTPGEVMSLNPRQQLLFLQSLPVIKATKIRYYDWWEWMFWKRY